MLAVQNEVRTEIVAGSRSYQIKDREVEPKTALWASKLKMHPTRPPLFAMTLH